MCNTFRWYSWIARSTTTCLAYAEVSRQHCLVATTQYTFKSCYVVGEPWGTVSADILFSICRQLPPNDTAAVLAFVQIFAAAGVIETCEPMVRGTLKQLFHHVLARPSPRSRFACMSVVSRLSLYSLKYYTARCVLYNALYK